MEDAEIQCLKDSIDRLVEIQTRDGEHLIAKVISVFDGEDKPNIFYQVISSSTMEWYKSYPLSDAFSLDFDRIVSVRPVNAHSEA
jgi:hypothetical protein